MSTVEEIQNAIEALPNDEYRRIMEWMYDRDLRTWDAQLEKDVREGRLDFLYKEAMEEKNKGNLKEL